MAGVSAQIKIQTGKNIMIVHTSKTDIHGVACNRINMGKTDDSFHEFKYH